MSGEVDAWRRDVTRRLAAIEQQLQRLLDAMDAARAPALVAPPPIGRAAPPKLPKRAKGTPTPSFLRPIKPRTKASP